MGVTHLHDKALPPLAGTPFDDVEHMLLTDYLLHWVDISRTWLADGGAGRSTAVQAVDSRVPGQPAEARNPWSATVHLGTATGATASLRITGSNVATEPGCPFWVHGTSGTLRGSVLFDSDRLEVDDGTTRTTVPLTGAWFVDGFAAAMGELMCAVAEDRQPENSATDAAESVRLVLAARESAEAHGMPVEVTGEHHRRPGAGGPGHRPGVRRRVAELEPGVLVPRRSHGSRAGEGVGAPDAVPPRRPGGPQRVPGRGAPGRASR